jgi:trimethylamine---corrinoid protein Co-methyltransferase
LIYATLPTVADMRSGAYASGAIETGILHMGHSQLARYYNVPSGGYVGLTNSKINDAQSGYETGMSTVAAVLGGADMLNMTGLMDGLMSFDYAKVAIDDEIALMLKQIKRGLEYSEENLATDVVQTVGPGGMFLDHATTLKNMKTTGLLPNISDRFPRRGWSDKGAADSNTRGMNRVRKLLSGDFPSLISPELDAQIRAEFPGMVAGDFVPFDAPEAVGAALPSRN